MPFAAPEPTPGPTTSDVVHIWVRSTIDWGDPVSVERELFDAFRQRVELWDATFVLPYRRFRETVVAIARDSLDRVEGARVSAWDEIPDGALVLPVDDDDWFAPDAATTLLGLRRDGGIGARWPASFLETPIDFGHRLYLARRRLRPSTPPRYLCSTNSYAVVKGPDTELVARRHVRASSVFAEHARDVVVLERPLSLVNRTLASQTALLWRRERLTRRQLLRKARAYRRLYRRVPAAHPWAAEYVARMDRLMDDLAAAGVQGR